MTTVVAAAVDRTVVIAADSLTNVYDRPIIGGARKVRRMQVGAEWALCGFAGDGGIARCVDHVTVETVPDEDNADDVQQWASAVAAAISGWAVDEGLHEAGRMDSHVLFGWRGRLWTIVHGQAIPHADGRAALGSGEGPAMGALDALLDVAQLPPGEAVLRACAVAIARDKHSAEPITVELLLHPDDAREVAAEPR